MTSKIKLLTLLLVCSLLALQAQSQRNRRGTSSSSSVVSSSSSASSNTTNASSDYTPRQGSNVNKTSLNYTVITDCYSCSWYYNNTHFCNVNNQYGYCCPSNDTSTNCTHNPSINVDCSYSYEDSGPLFYSYCLGITSDECGGANSFSLVTDENSQPFVVTNVTNYEDQNITSYLACYWHFYINDYEFKDGSFINVRVVSQLNVEVYMFGGNSRENASIAVTTSNASLSTTTYSVDASAEVMLMMVPVEQSNNTYFEFSVYASGDQYSWLESLFIGEKGDLYFYIAVSVGGVIALILIVVIILCICKCCCGNNKAKKINPEDRKPTQPPQENNLDYTAERQKLADDPKKTLDNDIYNFNPPVDDKMPKHLNDQQHTNYGQNYINQPAPPPPVVPQSNQYVPQGKPKIQKYNQGAQPSQEDVYNNNPFLPSNIQKNKQTNQAGRKNF